LQFETYKPVTSEFAIHYGMQIWL